MGHCSCAGSGTLGKSRLERPAAPWLCYDSLCEKFLLLLSILRKEEAGHSPCRVFRAFPVLAPCEDAGPQPYLPLPAGLELLKSRSHLALVSFLWLRCLIRLCVNITNPSGATSCWAQD